MQIFNIDPSRKLESSSNGMENVFLTSEEIENGDLKFQSKQFGTTLIEMHATSRFYDICISPNISNVCAFLFLSTLHCLVGSPKIFVS